VSEWELRERREMEEQREVEAEELGARSNSVPEESYRCSCLLTLS